MFSNGEFLTFQSPESLGLARMPAKSIFFHFSDEKSAMESSCRNRGEFYMGLAGTWQFKYFEIPPLSRIPLIPLWSGIFCLSPAAGI